MDMINKFAKLLNKELSSYFTIEEIRKLIEIPHYEQYGDVAFPCFTLAKLFKKAPTQIANELSDKLNNDPLFEKVTAHGPYVNGYLNKHVVSFRCIADILEKQSNYGTHSFGIGKSVVIDFSSPNIAKPFSMGHLRSTVIGNALANIYQACGYKVIKINYLGDWGTQFGKLIVAYHRWGNEEKVKTNPIKELLHLYVKFHTVAEKNHLLEEEARQWFKKLENGDKEAIKLWKWFREESLHEFDKIYKLLGVHFDSYNGEAYYNDKMGVVIEQLSEQGLLTQSEGAMVVQLSEFGLPPCLIMKSDGATLYATRDITAAMDRKKEYDFVKAVYVVGQEQQLHFQQIVHVLEKLKFPWAKDIVHVPFGFVLKNGQKMSTRKGKVILLENVINEAISLALKNIKEKNPNLINKAEVARMVGVGAIIFHDLKNERMNNFEFTLEEMLKFEGATGPYIQYTYARARSILRKSGESNISVQPMETTDSQSWATIKLLMKFPYVTERSFQLNEPSQIAKYLIHLSQEFNKYYGSVKILGDDRGIANRLALVKSITIVLRTGLELLGLEAPEEM